MRLEVVPLGPALGAEIRGAGPTPAPDDDTFAAIRAAWREHCLLLFRDVDMTPQQHVDFTRRFGELHVMPQPEFNLPEHPEIFVVSNVVENGRGLGMPRVGLGWHTDGQSKPRPNMGSMLHAHRVPPEDGDTLFANMYAAYEALPGDLKRRVEGRRVRYSRVRWYPHHYGHMPPLTEEEKARMPDSVHPLVRTHPETGRRALYFGRMAWEVIGIPREEGLALLKELEAFATQDRFVYRHRWRAGDALLWDNRCLMHCATPFDDERHERHMYRTTLEGDVPV